MAYDRWSPIQPTGYKTKPSWMTDDQWNLSGSGGIENRTDKTGWSAQDQLRPTSTQMYDKTTGRRMGAGYNENLYSKSEPDINRQEWNQHLQKAWGETPITTQNIGGKLVASRTMDASGVQGYGKWGGGTDGGVNGKPLSQTYILPQGALDFKFAQSNAPLSEAQRNSSFRFGGNYSNATVEKSPTRFTGSDFKLSGSSGGLTDFTTGEQFSPSRAEFQSVGGGAGQYTYPSEYNRFGGVSNSSPDSWNDEWAQKQGFKNYQDYLNRK